VDQEGDRGRWGGGEGVGKEGPEVVILEALERKAKVGEGEGECG